MADEIELITTNAAGDSWVDSSPAGISTGYQAQNTTLEGMFTSMDISDPYYDETGDNVIIPVSAIIDDGGLPFVVKSEITLSASSMVAGTYYYLQIVAGTDNTHRSIELTSTVPSWDSAKMGFYSNGHRALNWALFKKTSAAAVVLFRRQNSRNEDKILRKLNTTGEANFGYAAYFHNNAYFDGEMLPTTAPTYGSHTIITSSTAHTGTPWTPPRGVYAAMIFDFSSNSDRNSIYISNNGGSTYAQYYYDNDANNATIPCFFADGVNSIISVGSIDTSGNYYKVTITYLKF